jgi:hypothetical protein
MRTTISIDDDIFNIARQKAQKERVYIGHVISDLARQGIRNAQQVKASRPIAKSKYPVFGKRNETITSEHIDNLKDQEGI